MKKVFFFMLKCTLRHLHYINNSSMFLFFSQTRCLTEIVSSQSSTYSCQSLSDDQCLFAALMFPFSTLWDHQQFLWFSYDFRESWKEILEQNGLMLPWGVSQEVCTKPNTGFSDLSTLTVSPCVTWFHCLFFWLPFHCFFISHSFTKFEQIFSQSHSFLRKQAETSSRFQCRWRTYF